MAILSGIFKITRDAELRYVPSGEAVINLQLVYKCGSKKQADGYYPSQFIEGGLWGKRAESLQSYLTKGTQVFCAIEDVAVQTFAKQDQTIGTKLAGRISVLDLISDGNRRQEEPQQAPAQRATPGPRPGGVMPARAPAMSGIDDDWDIPF